MTCRWILFNPTLRALVISVLAALSGCSSGADGDAGAGGSSGSAGSGASSGSGGNHGVAGLQGTFQAELVPADAELGSPAFTRLLGVVFDGPSPPSIPLELDSEQSGCQLLVPSTPFCTTSCGTMAACVDDDECLAYPNPQNVGTVRVQGLGPSEVVMDPMAPAYAYQPAAALPNPPCSEGASVRVLAEAFGIEGKCIAPFGLLGPDPIPVASGQGIPLTWTPPGDAGISRVQVTLDIAHHGGKTGEIDCDVPDTGSFEIPEPLVTKLVSLGLAGFPRITVGRLSTATSAAESGVKLVVSSANGRDLDTGVDSCTTDDECPTGTTCQSNDTCQ